MQRAERTESRGAVGLSVISTSTISNNLGMSLVFQMPLRIMPVSTKKKARVARLARYRYAPAVVLLFPSAPALGSVTRSQPTSPFIQQYYS